MYQRRPAPLLPVSPGPRARSHRHEGNPMTVTAIPVVPVRSRGSLGARGARMAPYTTARGDLVRPGCYGISDGGSITGDLIRHVTGARACHAFIYVVNGQVVEVAPPAVRIA